jgi:hypothetical protein
MDIGLLHNCCDQNNIRVKDIFFWSEQYLHDNVHLFQTSHVHGTLLDH